jgi:MSHA pilin protein MshC
LERRAACGFTIPELVAGIVIMGILAAVAAPKLFGGYDEAAFAEETTAALRYAQRSAITMQRTVCVDFTGVSLTLRYLTNYPDSNCAVDPSLPLLLPATGLSQVSAGHARAFVSSASYNPVPVAFSFDRTGRPSAGQVVTLNNGITITVGAETGYVRSP